MQPYVTEQIKKLKTGDKVKKKNKAELYEFFPQYKMRCGLVESMLEYAGKEFYIERASVIKGKCFNEPYFLLKGTNGYCWSVYLFDFEAKKKKQSLE